MSASPLEDPRRAKVEAYAQAAETAWRAKGHKDSDDLFAKAAAIEEEVAREVPAASPRTRSVLAISAVALWYKARNYARAKRTAYTFLATEAGLTTQGRSALEELVDRCSREHEIASLGADPTMALVEIKLDGGDVAKGVAPANVVRDRRAAGLRLLMRSADLEAKLPYRERGESELEADEQIQIYEAPALAASYGLRFYVTTGRQQRIPSEQKATPERVVERFLDLAAAAGTEDAGEALRARVSDAQYARSFVRDFAEIAPDGEQVGRVVCSSPSWKIRTAAAVLEPKHRQKLKSAASPTPTERRLEGTPVEGRLLKFTQQRGDRWIEIEGADEKSRLVFVADKKLVQTVLKLSGKERDVWVRVFAKYKGGPRGPQRDVMTGISETTPPTRR
jgi:hypothetical protein